MISVQWTLHKQLRTFWVGPTIAWVNVTQQTWCGANTFWNICFGFSEASRCEVRLRYFCWPQMKDVAAALCSSWLAPYLVLRCGLLQTYEDLMRRTESACLNTTCKVSCSLRSAMAAK